MTPKALQGLLSSQFPLNATCWSQATDEVRDMARHARVSLGIGEDGALNFRELRTPAMWNERGINYIIGAYEQMTELQRAAFIEEHKDWIEPWQEAARKSRDLALDRVAPLIA